MKFENIYKETEENMRLALLSLWTPGSHPMRPAVNELFDREPLLAEPVFQSTFGWEPSTDDTWRETLNPDVIKKLGIGEKHNPYKHQAESWKSLAEGKSIVVTSGTGSGKTECFMYPVLNDLYEQGRPNAIEAIFLYPLNALMEDQKKRLSEYCKATNLHFAVYNGDTPEYRENGQTEKLPNEVTTRDNIRDNKNHGTRPEILLTNPSMLEYILVRQQDQKMLEASKGKLRWIVIDEAHSYSGSAAVELAYQIKRILDAFEVTPEQVRFACTSATIGGEDGAQSLAEFISTLTGQPVKQIKVIGGHRLVSPLDRDQLASDLQRDNLPSIEKVLTLRDKINDVPGMTLQQMWEWLRPDVPFDRDNLLPALRLLDRLCEMSQGDTPVLSLRAHFFMRAIGGLYACANPDCGGVNPAVPIYGHLTTYKSSVCPKCGVPLLEIVQCKRCGGFVLMGCSDSQTHKIFPCEDGTSRDDYFAIDLTEEQEEEDERGSSGRPDIFYLMPYEKEKFFNPIGTAHAVTMDISHKKTGSEIEVHSGHEGQWVEVRKDDGHSHCPGCGALARGKRLNLKHFRIPINFINQAISPVFLKECAPEGRSWGKYIAFTDSRQGTAISAKTFNINVERIQSRERLLQKLSSCANTGVPNIDWALIPVEHRETILAQIKASTPQGLSLESISDCIFDGNLFEHIQSKTTDKKAYKAALMRHIIGRKPLYEDSAENMGLITLVYPGLKEIRMPASVIDYIDKYGGSVEDKDWRDFLKLSLDYFFRVGNHIQPLIDGEREYVRDSGLCTPVTSPDDLKKGISHWPLLNEENGVVTTKQHRLIVLLCAGLGINSLPELQKRKQSVSNIMKDAWNDLVNNKIITMVRADDQDGYNKSKFYRDNLYVGCYFLDLSGEDRNEVCKIELTKEVWECPVTGKLIDTTFCGFSPMISGEISKKLFDKYKCSDKTIQMPVRPENNDQVDSWLVNDGAVNSLKDKGLWSDRHKYAYKHQPSYIAAEHSAQQPKRLLREYTSEFSQQNPKINVLHCSTTMEMGVDIGDIDVVVMDTVPPTAANYLQRVGRAGRKGQSKAIAFSLCSNTPVGQNAFANPMWALHTMNHMVKVLPSNTIIQRHINSFFFRQFVCMRGSGIQASISVDEFMTSICDNFIRFLDEISTNREEEKKFKKVFGENTAYTVERTKNSIQTIQKEYNEVLVELRDAFERFKDDTRRQLAISNQIRKIKSEGLLNHLSIHQFIPNANMPTGVVTFDFTEKEQADKLKRLHDKIDQIQNKLSTENNEIIKFDLQNELSKVRREIDELHRTTTASRDIHTALNEYAPEQTVVVNEKNYVSAGIKLLGAYNEETQTRAIYHCTHCGHTDYRSNIEEGKTCPICQNPYHSIIDRNHGTYTLAYEPIGFSTDQNADSTREEKTEKHFYDIRPVLLKTDWSKHVEVNMCEITGSGEAGNILFYNVGVGHGFAFCKRCGRASVEYDTSTRTTPDAVKPSHLRLWGGPCEANDTDIARHVVFTGNHPTCYTVLRFKIDASSSEYENDKQLVYSLGVVLKRALAKSEGIDEGEIDFGVKQEIDAWVLFIYDTAKGGCGYSLKLMDPVQCQEVFDMARQSLEETTCNCHIEGGACARCMIDRNNYQYANLLSKGKALNWLNRQKNNKAFEVPSHVKESSPFAKIAHQSLKEIVKHAVNDPDVEKITLCVSDMTDDYAITNWTSVRSEMGKLINTTTSNRKGVSLVVEYHPELHNTMADKLPFINLKDKFPDCQVSIVKDMGKIKTAIIVETNNKVQRYFTDQDSLLSFSNKWGDDCDHVFADSANITFESQQEPTYEVSPTQVVREGLTRATTFQVKNYFSKAIAPNILEGNDLDALREILNGKHVDISFSDMYVNSALASLMLVYLIDEMKHLFGFIIDDVTLQLDSPKRKCVNERFNDWSPIGMNFPCQEDADKYTDELFQNVIGIDPEHSFSDADHHRWLRIKAKDGGSVEIRPDHGISGGYRSDSKYMNIESLNGSVLVTRNNEDVLYYIIFKRK
ncbi:MAG: DEAD/DEAH box helicase [Bacteroidaceae bacterium]|nr:DEAD/DEAH box helicase [Bacteroidaceae bacterium]